MGISVQALANLVQSTINRYTNPTNPSGVLTASEQSALLSAAQPGGVLDNFIATQINTRSAAAPAGAAAGAQAIFSTGRLNDTNSTSIAAWLEANNIAANSNGKIYSINQTDVGSWLNQTGSYDGAINAVAAMLGPFPASAALRDAVMQVVNGAGSYNFAVSAPANALVVYGFGANANSIFYNTEVPAFAAFHSSSASFNSVSIAALSAAASFNPASANSSFGTTDPVLTASMNTIGYNSATSAFSIVSGPNASSAISNLIANMIAVTTSGDTVMVSQGANFQLTGNGNTVNSGSGATITLVSGDLGDKVNLNNGTVVVQSYAGSWGTDALTVNGSGNTITTGVVDVLLVQGNSNNISAGDSSYIGVLTGSNSTTVTMTHGVVFVGAGVPVYISGNNNTIQVAASDIQNVTMTNADKFTFLEVNPDNTTQYITTNLPINGNTDPAFRDTVSYLANGKKFNEAKVNWDGTASIKYFNYTSVGSGWGETIILFDSSGKAVQQYTLDADGSVYVTVFANSASRPINVTYFFGSKSAADTAVASNSWNTAAIQSSPSNTLAWSGASAIIVAPNGGPAQSYSLLLGSLPNFSSTGGALSGVSQIQWYVGLTSTTNMAFQHPTTFLGNNQATWNQVVADAGNLASIAIDPLVLNLAGKSVDTTAQGENGVHFDMLGDGVQRETGWVTAGEAILIDGSQVPTSGALFVTPRQLAELDVDGDGVVTAAEGSSLRIWEPGATGNGGTISTLQQLGIAAINLDWKALWTPQPGATPTPMGTVDHGNLLNSAFTFTYTNGAVGQGADVSFEVGGAGAGAVQAAAQGLIQAAAGFSTLNMSGMSTVIAAAQTMPPSSLLAAPSPWHGGG